MEIQCCPARSSTRSSLGPALETRDVTRRASGPRADSSRVKTTDGKTDVYGDCAASTSRLASRALSTSYAVDV
jgi:hypothetical protein